MWIYIFRKTRFKILYLPNFIIELFLEEKLLAIKFNLWKTEPPGHSNIQKSTAFLGLILPLVDSKQLKMHKVKMSRKMKNFFTVQDIVNGHDLPGEDVDFEATNLKKYFDKESWHVIIQKSMLLPFYIG